MTPSPRPVSRRLLFPASGLIALSLFVHACGGGGGGGGGSNPPAPSPTPGPSGFVATSVFPANSATNVARRPLILIGFNDIVNGATMSASTVQLLQGATPVATTLSLVSCDGTRIQMIPNAALAAGLVYTISLTSGLQDDDGEGLTAVTFNFTTSPSGDITAPGVPGAFTADPNPGTETTEMLLTWTDATDDISGTTAIRYAVFMETQPVCFDYSSPVLITGPGDTQVVVPGLSSRTLYTFTLRAIDEGNNMGLPTGQVNETTFTSFLGDVRPIVAASCASCHVPGAQASNPPYNINMDYSTGPSTYTAWVGANRQCAGGAGFAVRVVPGDAANSFLWNKISGQPSGVVCGAQMPFGLPPLSTTQQDVFFDWIEEGALNN